MHENVSDNWVIRNQDSHGVNQLFGGGNTLAVDLMFCIL